MNILTLDTETSTHTKGNPFNPKNILVSIHTKLNNENTICKFYDTPDFKTVVSSGLRRVVRVVGHNIKFDIHWLTNVGISLPTGIRVWDTMLAEFILSGQTSSFTSLNELAERYGLGRKHDLVAEYWEKGISTEDIPRDIVEEYGNWDVDLTYQVYLKQLEDLRMTPKLLKLILLEGADLLVLQKMEYHGLKYNRTKSLELAKQSNERINEIELQLFKLGGIEALNFDSDIQLSAFLYGGSWEEEIFQPVTAIYKSGPRTGLEYTQNKYVRTDTHKLEGYFKPVKGSELKREGVWSTAGDILLQLRATSKLQKLIIGLLTERADLSKLSGTYYEGLPKLMGEMGWDEFIHGQYNQVIARTGRLSSSRPNMQNNPPAADELFESRYVN